MKKQNQGMWQSVKRFLPYFKPYKKIFVFDLFCVFVATIIELAFPQIVRIVTNDAMNTGGIDISLMTIVVISLIGMRLIEVFCKFFMVKWGHMSGAYVERDLRENLFRHYQELPHSFYDNNKIGTLMSRISTDLFEITEFAHHCPEEFFMAAVKIIGIFVIMMFFDVPVTLCLFAVLPFMVVFAVFYNKKMRATFKKNRVQMGDLNATVEDSLAGVRVVKSFANEQVEQQKFEEGNRKFLKIKEQNYQYMASYNVGLRVMDAIMYVLILVLAAVFQLRVDLLVTYVLYATTLLTSIKAIADYTEQFQKGVTAFERYSEIMDIPVDLCDKPDAQELTDVKGDILFDKVCFRYIDGDKDVLHDIDIEVKQGEVVAIVGPSGGGKTTLASLVPRFYDVTGGSIKIDGKDIRDVTLKSLRQNIGVVQQDVYLFWGTVADNIRYGKLDATMDEVMLAAKLAGADEFINKMPDGYDSYVGERGVKLSGGQKQRISIARVFLKNPPILILDEATSALDNESEVLVQKSLDQLSHGRTTVVIAHRLSTIRNATKIVVLTDKGIVEQGTHEQLMQQNGLYKKLYDLSSSAGNSICW
ncbi:MAG: ABC transporter ATP-binding protein [Clostridiales bacterium]|nr:ABC transporter ATP-binding protein [Clostridiales bacterium]